MVAKKLEKNTSAVPPSGRPYCTSGPSLGNIGESANANDADVAPKLLVKSPLGIGVLDTADVLSKENVAVPLNGSCGGVHGQGPH
jgi:hypothetical protein